MSSFFKRTIHFASRIIGSDNPVVWLPQNFFLEFYDYAKLLIWTIPVAFIAIKVLDRHLEFPGQDATWYIAAGFFGKIDDLSFWVLIAALLSTAGIMKAATLLPPLPPTISECIKQRELRFCGIATAIAIALYLLVMALTGGTFFNKLPPDHRHAQVLEGCLNVLLVIVFYWYFGVSLSVFRRFSKAVAATSGVPLSEELKRAGQLILNAPLTILTALCTSLAFFPLVKYLGEKSFMHFGYRWLNWTMFRPEPFSEVANGIVAALFMVALMFLPYLALYFSGSKILRQRCRISFNWTLLVLLFTLQAGPAAVAIVVAKGEGLRVVKVS